MEQPSSPLSTQPVPLMNTPPTPAVPVPTAPVSKGPSVGLVWQWLTYALWFWTLGALSAVLSATLAFFVGKGENDVFEGIVYFVAALICLLPIAFVIDKVYSKQETQHKTGFAGVLMVLHAVIAFLVGLGTLIGAVMTLLSLASTISNDATDMSTLILGDYTLTACI